MPNGLGGLLPTGAPPPGGGGGPGPGGGGGDIADIALSALGQLTPKAPNPTQALAKAEEALDLAHKLIMTVLPQVSMWNPKVSRDLHGIGQRLVAVRMDIRKESAPSFPPELMISGGQGDTPMGLPPGGGGTLGGGGGY